jgi:hypothetical protein
LYLVQAEPAEAEEAPALAALELPVADFVAADFVAFGFVAAEVAAVPDRSLVSGSVQGTQMPAASTTPQTMRFAHAISGKPSRKNYSPSGNYPQV